MMLRFFQFNIHEMTLGKVSPHISEQAVSALEIMRGESFDFASLQEIAWDGGQTLGAFVQELTNRGNAPSIEWFQHFSKANTGSRSTPFQFDGVNFGRVPGQYSGGVLSRFPLSVSQVIAQLPWRVFNPQRDLSVYRASDGSPLPNDMELFDKCFTDLKVNCGAASFHLIQLHAVPPGDFGNPKSPNLERHGDQMKFLKWYLFSDGASFAYKVGATEHFVRALPAGTPFVVIGDLNGDVGRHDVSRPGFAVLREILEDSRVSRVDPVRRCSGVANADTYMPLGNEASRPGMRLDYIIPSRQFRVREARVIAPDPEFKVEGTFADAHQARAHADLLRENGGERHVEAILKRQDKGAASHIVFSVSRDYALARRASDHFPVFAALEWVGHS